MFLKSQTTSVKTQNTFHAMPKSAAFLYGVSFIRLPGISTADTQLDARAREPARRLVLPPPPQNTHEKDPH